MSSRVNSRILPLLLIGACLLFLLAITTLEICLAMQAAGGPAAVDIITIIILLILDSLIIFLLINLYRLRNYVE